MEESIFIKGIEKSLLKKISLFEKEKLRYIVRSILGGAFLTLTTIAGAYIADGLNGVGLYGKAAFSLIFSFGLLYILFLGAELATSNMMYFGAGLYLKKIKLSKAAQILFICILFNFIGALIVGLLFSQTSTIMNMKANTYLFSIVEGKLSHTNGQILFGGILANIFVNIAVISFMIIKDVPSKFFIVISAIFMFVLIGLDHLVANFGSFSLAMFSKNILYIDSFTFFNVLRSFIVATVANTIGGASLGAIYAWLNSTKSIYKD